MKGKGSVGGKSTNFDSQQQSLPEHFEKHPFESMKSFIQRLNLMQKISKLKSQMKIQEIKEFLIQNQTLEKFLSEENVEIDHKVYKVNLQDINNRQRFYDIKSLGDIVIDSAFTGFMILGRKLWEAWEKWLSLNKLPYDLREASITAREYSSSSVIK